ncbi:hypothetical protein Y032_0015g2586 [Ancylostoma ceylanicum]|uniref:Uncharacterized protein n=1 Tax=Ancylostoma ceylanicum TaxID=53326 RepID=A0A016V9A1_9BILA|nr:hypothetical protein Y032_0015g2586 [Ancylostoma ceylanicum]
MCLKCRKIASKPDFRDGVCISLLEQIYVQRRVSPLIPSIGQAKTCSPDVVVVAGSQRRLEEIPPLLQEVGTLTIPKTGFSLLLRFLRYIIGISVTRRSRICCCRRASDGRFSALEAAPTEILMSEILIVLDALM